MTTRASAHAYLTEKLAASTARQARAVVDLKRVLSWCKTRGIRVVFKENVAEGGRYLYDSNVIEVTTRFRPVSMVVLLLHECGHHLVGSDNERFAKGYPKQHDRRTSRTLDHRLAILEEEMEAWHRARKLRDRLRLSVSDADFDRVRRKLLSTYVDFVKNRGG